MIQYAISEHVGRKVRQKWSVMAEAPEQALRLTAIPPFKHPPGAANWHFIDDGLGGGALIDPQDADHCLRADPRPDDDEDYTERRT